MNYIKEMLKGILIGIANIIPGVSGGTMAVSMGVYDKIISSITNLFKDFKKSVKTLFPYAIGMGVGIIGLAFVIKFLLRDYPLQTSLAFIGMILGGLPILLSKVKGKKIGLSGAIVFLAFFAVIIIMQLASGNVGKEVVLSVNIGQMILLFVIGVLASATMVIPGVSGSMLLMILGYYNPIIKTITDFISSLAKGDITALLHNAGILIPFGIGVVVGIFAIAKLIELLLNKLFTLTYCGILGLVIASPIAILMSNTIAKIDAVVIITSVITFALGFLMSYVLGREKDA